MSTLRARPARGRGPTRSSCALLLAALLCACGDDAATPPAGPLAELALSPLDLGPSFSPGRHDYAVRCDAALSHLTLTARAAPGGAVAVTAPAAVAAARELALELDVAEGQAVVLTASAPGLGEAEYWIRCLPRDFPAPSVVAHPEVGEPTPGWYLLGNSTTKDAGGYAMIIDRLGTPIWYRAVSRGAVNVDRYDDGVVSFSPPLGPAFGIDPQGQLQIVHLATGQVESLRAVDGPTDHHELLRLPSGNRLLLSYPLRPRVDLTGLQDYGEEETIADCLIEEIDPSGARVWQWRASEHVDPARESTYPLAFMIDGAPVVDVYHCNAIDADEAGDLLLSARHTDSIFKIVRSTGRVQWKLGGAPVSKDDARIIRVRGDGLGGFYRQHDARFRPGGRVSLFDDQTAMAGPARGVEYAVDVEAGLATLVWQSLGPASSAAMGGLRRYADGSSVIAWGALTTGPALAFTEVDGQGRALLEVTLPPGNFSYRAVKAPPGAFDIDVLRRSVSP